MDSLEGVEESDIQEVLGHDHRSTTHLYLQRIGEARHRAIEAMERATMRSRLQIRDGGKASAGEGSEEESHTDSHTDRKKALTVAAEPSVSA